MLRHFSWKRQGRKEWISAQGNAGACITEEKKKWRFQLGAHLKIERGGKASRDLCMRLCSCWKKGLSIVVSPAWKWFGTSAAEITLLSVLSGVGNSKVTAARPGTLLMPGTDLEGPFQGSLNWWEGLLLQSHPWPHTSQRWDEWVRS